MKKPYLLILFLFLFSCSPYTNSQYFQGLDRNPELNHKINNFSPQVIQIGDELALQVKSLSPEGSAIFNSGAAGSISGSSPSTGDESSAGSGSKREPGWLVNKNGEIELPLVHTIKVAGLTVEEAEKVIQKAITPFVKEPLVTLYISNFKVTVIGDVGHPTVLNITTDNVSIPQALSLAGDITASGKRDNILLIREINGERKYVNIDMTSSKLLESPYYYLKNNDMLYVEEGRGKFISISPVRQNLSIFLSLVSFIIVLLEVARHKF